MIQNRVPLVGPCYLPLPFECLSDSTEQTFTAMRARLAIASEEAETAIEFVRDKFGAQLVAEGDFPRYRSLQADLDSAAHVLAKDDERDGLRESSMIFIRWLEDYSDSGFDGVAVTKLLGLATRLMVVYEQRSALHGAELREITTLHAEAITARMQRASVVTGTVTDTYDDLPTVGGRSSTLKMV